MKFITLILLLVLLASSCGRKKTNHTPSKREVEAAHVMPEKKAPLEIAIETSDVFLLQNHLKNGLNPNKQFANGHTALTLAAEKGYLSIIKILVENGSSIDLKNK